MKELCDLTGQKIGALSVIKKGETSKSRTFKMDMQMRMWKRN